MKFAKMLIMSILWLAFSGTVYSFDRSNVTVEYVGNYTSHQYISEANDLDTLKRGFQEGLGPDFVIDQFFVIDDEDEDSEDVDMVEWVLNNSLPVRPNNGDTFDINVIRGMNYNSVDGWLLIVRYHNGWVYVMYYYAVHLR